MYTRIVTPFNAACMSCVPFSIKTSTSESSTCIFTLRPKLTGSNSSRMRFTQLLASCSLLVLCWHGSTALKCRTDEHQASDQFQQVIQQCRDRLLQNDRRMTNENSASDDDSDGDDSYEDNDSSDSDERDNSDKKSNNGRTGSTNTTMTKNSRSNNNGDERSNSRRYEVQTSSTRPYPYNHNMMGNSSSSRSDLDNERFSRNMTSRNGGSNSNSNYGNNDMRSNQPDQACVVHCFFDELNLVDENGFPEKSAVSKIMTQNIRDRELQNFIQEAVMGCFHMMNAVRSKEQCKFSQNLLNCLASRGREKCEDWDYQQ